MSYDLNKLDFRIIEQNDHVNVLNLINHAYRAQKDRSWTSEFAHVDGARITADQLSELIEQSNQVQATEILFVAYPLNGTNELQILGCIGMSIVNDSIEIGTFAVDSKVQNQGLGKLLLNRMESYIAEHYPLVNFIKMWVLNVRPELINFYERRGYIRTGKTDGYPIQAGVGIPKKEIILLELEKLISRQI